MGHFFKAVLWKARQIAKMEYLFILMDHIIEALWKIQISMGVGYSIITMTFSIKGLGRMINHMDLIVDRFIQMVAFIGEIFQKV